MNADLFFKENQKEILKIFYEFHVIELPNGYIGEIQEAINELQKNNIELSKKNIIIYLKAKSKILSYIRSQGMDLVNIYIKNQKYEYAAGSLLPEWVIALSIILTILSHSLNIAIKLKEFLKTKPTDKENVVIENHAKKIIQTKEVKNLIMIIKDNDD